MGPSGDRCMDKVEHYRTLVKQILLRNAEYAPSLGQIESIPVVTTWLK